MPSVRSSRSAAARILRAERGGDPALDPAERAGRVHGAEPARDDRQAHVEPGDEAVDLRGELEAAVEHHPREGGQRAGVVREQHAEHDVVAVARHDDDRPLDEPVDDVRHRHRGDDQAQALAVEQLGVAVDEGALAGRHEVGDRGGAQQRGLGEGPHRQGCEPLLQRRQHVGALVGPDLVDDDTTDVGVHGPRCGHRGRGARGQLALLAVAGRGHEHQGGAEVGGDPRVGRELRRRDDVGEVGADDQHDVVVLGHGVEPVHDGAEGPVVVVVQHVVGHPPGPVGRQVRVGLLEEHPQQLVLVARPGRPAGRPPRARGGGPAD